MLSEFFPEGEKAEKKNSQSKKNKVKSSSDGMCEAMIPDTRNISFVLMAWRIYHGLCLSWLQFSIVFIRCHETSKIESVCLRFDDDVHVHLAALL